MMQRVVHMDIIEFSILNAFMFEPLQCHSGHVFWVHVTLQSYTRHASHYEYVEGRCPSKLCTLGSTYVQINFYFICHMLHKTTGEMLTRPSDWAHGLNISDTHCIPVSMTYFSLVNSHFHCCCCLQIKTVPCELSMHFGCSRTSTQLYLSICLSENRPHCCTIQLWIMNEHFPSEHSKENSFFIG